MNYNCLKKFYSITLLSNTLRLDSLSFIAFLMLLLHQILLFCRLGLEEPIIFSLSSALRSSHYCFLVQPLASFLLMNRQSHKSRTHFFHPFLTGTGPLAVGTGSDESPRHPASPKDSDYKAALIS